MPANKMPKYIGPNDLAEILGVSPRRITQLVAESKIQKADRGLYDVRQCVQDYFRSVVVGAEDEDISEAKRRKAVADASLAEIELKHKAGELVLEEEMRAAISADYGRLRSHLIAMPSKMAPLVVGQKDNAVIQQIASDFIDAALADLSGETKKDDSAGAEDAAATAKADG